MMPRSIRTAILAAAVATAPLASAQSLDSLKNQASDFLSGQSASSQTSSGGALLGSLSSGSLNLGSMQNVAGVLGYCQQQGYAKSTTEMVKDKLLGRLGGQQAVSQDSGYQQGLQGILQGEKGQRFNVSSLKSQVGEKVCGTLADQALSSFLGG